MRSIPVIVPLFLFIAGHAHAGRSDYAEAGGRYTAGPAGYSGLNIFAEWGNDDYYLRPSVNTYKSDDSDRYSSYMLGGGIDREKWSAGAGISVLPETGGYGNKGLYADFIYSPLGEAEDESFFEDFYFGTFLGFTSHEDLYSSSATVSGAGRRSSLSSRTSAFLLAQYDYGLTASVRIRGLRATVRFTRTSYDKDVTEEARTLPIDIGSIGVSGFPDSAMSLRLRCPGLPLSPEAGYSRTSYLLDQPSSEAYIFGLSSALGPLRISAGWENFNPGGGAGRRDYRSLGLSWPF